MDEILGNPEIGARKLGKLSDLYVHKILILKQEFLIAYTFNRGKKILTWEALAPHENFYRDLNR
jgi:hypothetical protein